MDYANCSLKVKDPKIVIAENKSRFELSNPGRLEVFKIQVDGCLLPQNLEKCDWMFATEKPHKKAYYIELKGCDLDKAISQLKSTLNHTKEKFSDFDRECFAVTTRIPKHGASVRKKCLEFHKTTGARLSVKNIVFSLTI